MIIVVLSTLAINPFSAGTDFRRQNLTSKVVPRTEKVKKHNNHIGFQMKQKEIRHF